MFSTIKQRLDKMRSQSHRPATLVHALSNGAVLSTAAQNGHHGANGRRTANGRLNGTAVYPLHPQTTETTTLDILREQAEQTQAVVISTLAEWDEAYQQFIKTKIDPLLQGKRHVWLKEIQMESDEELTIPPHERAINRGFVLSSLLTGVAVVTSPASGAVQFVACVPFAMYLMKDVYKRAYYSFKGQRRLTFPMLGAVNQTLLWLGGYYVLGGAILILSSTGQKIMYMTEVRAREQLINVFGQLPRHVWVMRQGVETKITLAELKVGDVLFVPTGHMIPVDGVIVDGYASIDQHRLTGESQPAEKEVGDSVLAATVVLAGRIYVEVEKAGQDTVAAQIGEMLQKTSGYQMAVTTKARMMADASVGPTLLVAALASLVVGSEGAVAITSTMFGLALMIGGPLTIMNFLTVATRRNILVKDGRSLDLLPDINTVIFDKTGTLTLEQPHVTHIHTFTDFDAASVLRAAAAVEQLQTHPIARAILTHAEAQGIVLPPIDDTSYELGYGIKADVEGKLVRVGSDRFVEMENIPLAPEIAELQTESHAAGHSLVFVALDDQLVGAIELEPTIRPEAREIVDTLQQKEMDVYIISGDQEGPTAKLAESLGIAHYIANVLPKDKAAQVERLQQEGRAVCFVGDGINDSIALKKANVSISLKGATNVAMDTAQIVFMDGSLERLPILFQLAEEMKSNLRLAQALAIVPTAFIWGGVFFFNMGIAGSASLFEVSLWGTVANAVRPLWDHRETFIEAGEPNEEMEDLS